MRLMTPKSFYLKGGPRRSAMVVPRGWSFLALLCLVFSVSTNTLIGAEQEVHLDNTTNNLAPKQAQFVDASFENMIQILKEFNRSNLDATQMQSLSNATQIAKQLQAATNLPEIPTHMMWVLVVLFAAWCVKSVVETC